MQLRFVRLAILSILILCGGTEIMAQRITDDQVTEYVKMALEEGKDQQTIINELIDKGVSQEQAMRVRNQLKQRQGMMGMKDEKGLTNTGGRTLKGKREDMANFRNQMDEEEMMLNMADTIEIDDKYIKHRVDSVKEDQVFGRNIFNSKKLNFIPNFNLATPSSYVLGPEDEIIINIWGSSQTNLRLNVSPDGNINIPNLGLVNVGNKTMKEAEATLIQALRSIYSDPDSEINISLGDIRTIQVNVMGEATAPGTYTLSSFSTIFHALYSAKGVNEIGSLRNVKVARKGKIVATLDVYDYIMNGNIKENICLREGDVVIIPPYEGLAKITGRIKRPMRYEMKKGESLATLLKYAGGFKHNAYKTVLNITRFKGSEYSIATVKEKDFANFMIEDGDLVKVDTILNRYKNRLKIRGAVYHPGIYELGRDIQTVKQLVETADGLLPEAFTSRAVLYRERPNRTREVEALDIEGILNGSAEDVQLRNNDILYIPSIHDLKDLGKVNIFGEIKNPGEYPYSDNMTLEDLVITAGGLKESASLAKVDISRRTKDRKSTAISDTIGQSFSFKLKDGFVIDGEPGFVLHPYDQVFVRRSPNYNEQVNVTVNGEVLYSGSYSLRKKSERLSEVIARAGGVTKFGYVRGAKLTRKANEEEIQRMKSVMEMLRREIAKSKAKDEDKAVDYEPDLKVDSTFTVGLNLEEALANPGGDADIVLREGDIINIPEYNNTIKISGEVMVPNTVSYIKGKNAKYYIGQAGGYANFADKKHKYIIYMNGQIAEIKSRNKSLIEPGSEIVVPNKTKRFRLTDFLATSNSLVSMATMITAMIQFMK